MFVRITFCSGALIFVWVNSFYERVNRYLYRRIIICSWELFFRPANNLSSAKIFFVRANIYLFVEWLIVRAKNYLCVRISIYARSNKHFFGGIYILFVRITFLRPNNYLFRRLTLSSGLVKFLRRNIFLFLRVLICSGELIFLPANNLFSGEYLFLRVNTYLLGPILICSGLIHVGVNTSSFERIIVSQFNMFLFGRLITCSAE